MIPQIRARVNVSVSLAGIRRDAAHPVMQFRLLRNCPSNRQVAGVRPLAEIRRDAAHPVMQFRLFRNCPSNR